MRLPTADGYPAQGAPFITALYLKAFRREPVHWLEYLVYWVLSDHLSPIVKMLYLFSCEVELDKTDEFLAHVVRLQGGWCSRKSGSLRPSHQRVQVGSCARDVLRKRFMRALRIRKISNSARCALNCRHLASVYRIT
jgi:hypothetical protein